MLQQRTSPLSFPRFLAVPPNLTHRCGPDARSRARWVMPKHQQPPLAAACTAHQHCLPCLTSALPPRRLSTAASALSRIPLQRTRILSSNILRVSAPDPQSLSCHRPQSLSLPSSALASRIRPHSLLAPPNLCQPTAAAACISTLLPTQRSALLPLARAHPQPLRS